jgi:hypothetical protein
MDQKMVEAERVFKLKQRMKADVEAAKTKKKDSSPAQGSTSADVEMSDEHVFSN